MPIYNNRDTSVLLGLILITSFATSLHPKETTSISKEKALGSSDHTKYFETEELSLDAQDPDYYVSTIIPKNDMKYESLGNNISTKDTPLNITVSCNDTHNLERDNLFSPNSSSIHFPPFRWCTWKLVAPYNTRLILNFNNFRAQICCDKLFIFDGPNSTFKQIFSSNASLAKIITPKHLLSTKNALFLRFTSDFEESKPGFNISYLILTDQPHFGSSKGSKFARNNSNDLKQNYVSLPSHTKISRNARRRNCKHDIVNVPSKCEDISTSGICPLIHFRSAMDRSEEYGTSYEFHYPHFPCRTWKITDTQGKKLRLHFNGFHSKTCCSEVVIYDGPDATHSLQFYRNNSKNDTTPGDVESSGNTLFLSFRSNASITESIATSGFNISYYVVQKTSSYSDYYSDEDVDYVVVDLPDYFPVYEPKPKDGVKGRKAALGAPKTEVALGQELGMVMIFSH